MISLDEQILAFKMIMRGDPVDEDILTSLRRLKRIEELMREPSVGLAFEGGVASVSNSSPTGIFKSMSAALLKQVEEEVK